MEMFLLKMEMEEIDSCISSLHSIYPSAISQQLMGSLSNHRVFSAFEPETVMLQGAVNCSHFLPGSAAAITVPPDRRKPQCA